MDRCAPLAVLIVAGLAGSTRAEPPPLPREPAPPPVVVQEEPPAPVAVPAEAPEEAWQLYHRAFAALAGKRSAEARSLLEGVVTRYPGHPAARRASAVLGRLGGAAPSQILARPEAPPEPRPGDPESPTRLARAELAIFQTFHGAIIGGEVCVIAGCNEAGAAVGLVLAGGVTGAVVSVAATQGGIEAGRRGAIDSGVVWGAFNGGMALIIAEPDEPATVGGVLLGGQLAGMLVGDLVWRAARPTEGQVALTNTFGIWAGVGAALGLVAFDADAESQDVATTLLVAADAGLIAGAVVASRVPMSRGRTLLIDAGGIVGLLAGGGTAVLIGGEETSEEVGVGAGLAGMAIGLATAAFLSRDWDDEP